MLDPEDLGTIDFIKKKKAGLKIPPRLTNSQSIKSVLSQYEESLQAEFSDIVKKKRCLKTPSFGTGEGRKRRRL